MPRHKNAQEANPASQKRAGDLVKKYLSRPIHKLIHHISNDSDNTDVNIFTNSLANPLYRAKFLKELELCFGYLYSDLLKYLIQGICDHWNNPTAISIFLENREFSPDQIIKFFQLFYSPPENPPNDILIAAAKVIKEKKEETLSQQRHREQKLDQIEQRLQQELLQLKLQHERQLQLQKQQQELQQQELQLQQQELQLQQQELQLQQHEQQEPSIFLSLSIFAFAILFINAAVPSGSR